MKKRNRWFYIRRDSNKPFGPNNRVGPFYEGRRGRVYDAEGKQIGGPRKQSAVGSKFGFADYVTSLSEREAA